MSQITMILDAYVFLIVSFSVSVQQLITNILICEVVILLNKDNTHIPQQVPLFTTCTYASTFCIMFCLVCTVEMVISWIFFF